MGDVLKGVQQVRTLKSNLLNQASNAAGFAIGGGNNYDPGFQDMDSQPEAQGADMSSGQQAYVDPLAPLPDSSQGQPPQASAVSAQSAGINNDQPQTPQPIDNPYAPDTPRELAAGQEDPIEVTGDDWKPHKEGWLGSIIDKFLMLRGRRPAFKEANDEQNVESALQGWKKDPARALNRLRQIDPNMMMKLDEHITKTGAENALETARRVNTMNESGKVIGNMIGGILNSSASPEQKSAMYARMLPSFQNYADKAGYPKEMFPDTYDEEKLGVLNATGITGYQQAEIAKGKETIKALSDWRRLRGAQLGAALENSIRHDMVNEREQERHNRTQEALGQTKEARQAEKTHPKIVQTPQGMMEVDPSGTRGRIGNQLWSKIAPGQWKRIK